jgi:hypothetical protein
MIPFFHLEDDFSFNHVKWVSEWLFFSAKWAMFSAISWREQVTFQWDNDVFRSVLGRQTREVEFNSVSSLKQQSTDRLVVPLGHSILIPSQLFFKCWARSGKAETTNFIVFGLTRVGIEVTTYRTWGEYTNHYTTDMVSFMLSPILLTHCYCVEKTIISTPISQLFLPPSSTSNRR